MVRSFYSPLRLKCAPLSYLKQLNVRFETSAETEMALQSEFSASQVSLFGIFSGLALKSENKYWPPQRILLGMPPV